jgi:hypothetical protein
MVLTWLTELLLQLILSWLQVLHVGAWEMKSAWIIHSGPPKAHLAAIQPSPSTTAEEVPAVAADSTASTASTKTRTAAGTQAGTSADAVGGSTEGSTESGESSSSTARAGGSTSAGNRVPAGTGVLGTSTPLGTTPLLQGAVQDGGAAVQAVQAGAPSRTPAASPRTSVTGRRSSESQRAGPAVLPASETASLVPAFTQLQVQ